MATKVKKNPSGKGKKQDSVKSEANPAKAKKESKQNYNAVFIALGIIAIIALAYYVLSSRESPSCFNGRQDNGETGVDCGGPCSNKCPTETTLSTADCGSLTSMPAKTRCIADQAVLKSSDSECSTISDPWYMNMCYRLYAADALDTRACAKINSSLDADECYKGVAVKKQDGDLCELIKDVSQKDTCYFRIGFDTKITSMCEKITSDSSKYRCIALAKKDYTYCGQINEQKGRDYCYERMSTLVPEIVVCGNIVSTPTKDSCIMNVAQLKVDQTMCDTLS
ncbi:MAG: hypothetical protein NTU61_00725, partial [Candidatus Altiarchaeota archaeon]|nr:hypothetical protein [Candidatus Altiarchaeota archaeon]